jgi:hypothetical protein
VKGANVLSTTREERARADLYFCNLWYFIETDFKKVLDFTGERWYIVNTGSASRTISLKRGKTKMEEETEEEELKEVMQRLILALKAKGWTGKQITELLVEILETEDKE